MSYITDTMQYSTRSDERSTAVVSDDQDTTEHDLSFDFDFDFDFFDSQEVINMSPEIDDKPETKQRRKIDIKRRKRDTNCGKKKMQKQMRYTSMSHTIEDDLSFDVDFFDSPEVLDVPTVINDKPEEKKKRKTDIKSRERLSMNSGKRQRKYKSMLHRKPYCSSTRTTTICDEQENQMLHPNNHPDSPPKTTLITSNSQGLQQIPFYATNQDMLSNGVRPEFSRGITSIASITRRLWQSSVDQAYRDTLTNLTIYTKRSAFSRMKLIQYAKN